MGDTQSKSHWEVYIAEHRGLRTANPEETQEKRTEQCGEKAMMGTLPWRRRWHNKDNFEGYGR